MMNPLQEKMLKEFREKFWYLRNDLLHEHHASSCMCHSSILRDLESWLTTTLEEVYKAGETKGIEQAAAWEEEGYNKGYKAGKEEGLVGSSATDFDEKEWQLNFFFVMESLGAAKPSKEEEKWEQLLVLIEQKRRKGISEGEKNGLSRAVEAVKNEINDFESKKYLGKEEFLSGHGHGLKRALYIIENPDEKEEAKSINPQGIESLN